MSNRTVNSSVKVSDRLNKQMSIQVIKDGFGMRGKNKWVIEAIESFLKLKDFIALVELASEVEDLSSTVSLRLPVLLVKEMDDAVLQIRKTFPLLEGVQSHIIRASILQKIIRSPNK